VCRIANVLKNFGIKKGDTVSIYLPMTWHAVAAFLACARIGAVHSVVFAGFSSESLRDRVQDCQSRVLITSDEGKRGGKTISTKAIVDAALKECPNVEHVLVLKRTGNQVAWTEGRDKWWHEEVLKVPSYCPPEIMASEDPLFILYVSTVSALLEVWGTDPGTDLDFRIHRKAKRSSPYDWRLFAMRCFDRQICLRCSPRRQICLHG
jgi:acetyl-CoA synthetase